MEGRRVEGAYHQQERAAQRGSEAADGPAAPQRPPVVIFTARHRREWPEHIGVQSGLYNDFAAEIVINGRTYLTVTHACRALSTVDPLSHERIATEADPDAAR